MGRGDEAGVVGGVFQGVEGKKMRFITRRVMTTFVRLKSGGVGDVW